MSHRCSLFARCAGAAVVVAAALTGCERSARAVDPSLLPVARAPGRGEVSASAVPRAPGRGGPEAGFAAAVSTDTRTHAPIDARPWRGRVQDVEEMLGEEEIERHRPSLPRGGDERLPLGGTLDSASVLPGPTFPGIGQTEWVPPDPSIAVGPNHIVSTVNMRIAFYDKAGTLQYSNYLNDSGDPGFFEPAGGRWFTFDPKCFYDDLAGRFVVVAPETYGNNQAWICLAVSDDSDPHGVWRLYRTDAVVWSGEQSFWWDYPGFGYDEDAYYVTGNLFGLNQGGWGGVGFRIFKKQPLLSGQAAQFWTLRDGASASAQVAQHAGPNQAPYFVSLASSNRLRVHAITDPITKPALVSTDVLIPSFRGPTGAPAAGGNSVSLIDARLFNARWINGDLYTAHHVSHLDGRNFARWYHLRTNNWPASGAPSLVQAGEVSGAGDLHTYFPAIYANEFGQVGLVHGMSGPSSRISVAVTGRNQSDPPGAMGTPQVLKTGPVDGGGRWGDYYDIALDPSDHHRFWVVGEYPESFGWATWIGSFTLAQPEGPVAVADDGGVAIAGDATAFDVSANDYHTAGKPFDIWYFDPVSAAGGTLARAQGSGSGGRSRIIYSAPPGYEGPDSFTYTLADEQFRYATTQVAIDAYDPNLFLEPSPAAGALPGIDANYYALVKPQRLPDFSDLTPVRRSVSPSIDYPLSPGPFADSGLADEVGAVFEALLFVPADAVYEFSLESDEGSRLWIGDRLVIDNDGLHSMLERSGRIGLQAGAHPVRVEYFENREGAGLIARVAGGGLPRQVIPPEMWARVNPCPADMNGDRVVDTGDFIGFLNAWASRSPLADFSADGRIDTSDVIAYLNLWVAGCQ